jgi:NADH-quinone oxidoreductase subunit J|uniref:NADH-ubiquinone oxidoreductase chain 6 n=1 Tax=Diphylleia rotans TaxID=190327 RepID=A0A146I6H0_9EUKA|nr:NADH dehydrogenase subunit 6 [Diphylleia rotans]BAU71438.1 NADH dehydrogenase subunit 6 [Diphylleia rotans]
MLDIAAHFFAGLMIISSIMVIGSRNPIHSIFFLILVFFNASALLLMLEVEFLALLLLVVYVGAVAVLFLFVVMMLNLHLSILSQNFFYYLPFGGLAGAIFLFELRSAFLRFAPSSVPNISGGHLEWVDFFDSFSLPFGLVLYTEYALLLIIASLILLLAMLGAIVLTGTQHSKKKLGSYKQDISEQIAREATITRRA